MTSAAATASIRLRAPRENGAALFHPPLDEAPDMLATNAERLRGSSETERWLATLAAEARPLLLEAAREYTSAYRDVSGCDSSARRPILLAGHQPQLFHPGVWFKNYVLSRLGERLQATAINLIVDNDVQGPPTIAVPAGSADEPRLERIAFDDGGVGVPYEERMLQNRDRFTAFADQVRTTVQPFSKQPLVDELWKHAAQALERGTNLGRLLAEARHRLEGAWGWQTLEVPLSVVYSHRPFVRFLDDWLRDGPRFVAIYNEALREYRRRNRLRSRSHPVPDLTIDDEGFELPLWIWTTEHPRRASLFARKTADGWSLTDRKQLIEKVSGSFADHYDSLAKRGIKIRPKALATTLYARLVLGDLFLHGIGGAKYDELTDDIIRRYYGMEPPRFLTTTATNYLVDSPDGSSPETMRKLTGDVRGLSYHPEQFVEPSDAVAQDLVAWKRKLLTEMPPRGSRRAWHQSITEVNAWLQPHVETKRREIEALRESLARAQGGGRIVGSREFAFCLFPAERLREGFCEAVDRAFTSSEVPGT